MLDVEHLYEQHASNIRGFIVKRIRADDDVIDDLVQDIWARVWSRRHLYHDRGHDPRAWLFRIAQNALTDEFRRRGKALVELPLLFEADHARVTADAGCSRHIDRLAILSALGHLTPLQRRIVVLRYLNGASIADTAVLAGVSEEAVKKLAQRGLITMRRALREAA